MNPVASSTSESNTSHRYNFIYEKLVLSDDDFIGIVAYGLYKREKIQFFKEISTAQGRPPTEEECDTFHIASNTESRLSLYRDQAESKLLAMFGDSIDDEISRREDDIRRNYLNNISDAVKKNIPGFFSNLAASIAGGIVIAVLAIIFALYVGIVDKSTEKAVKTIIEQMSATDPAEETQVNNHD